MSTDPTAPVPGSAVAASSGGAGIPAGDDERRLRTMLTHTLHTTMALLLVVAVVRAWQLHEHPWPAAAIALVSGAAYAASRRYRWAFGVLLVAWIVGSVLTSGFAWLSVPLIFLVIHALPRWPALAVVAVITVVSVWATHSVVGPVMGTLATILAATIFAQQRSDTARARALVAELRETQGSLAEAERERGILAERERLARELHDTVAQGLASIVMLARTAPATDAGEALALIEATAREDLAQTRALVRDLTSPGEVSLEDALRALVADTRARTAASGRPLDISFTEDGSPRALTPEVARALQRGAQASVANVVQHAGATRCVVGLGWFDDHVVLDIVDDGAGFDPAVVGDDSFGIRGLRSRMAEVGGRVAIDSVPGEGTTVAVTVPTERPERPTTQEATA